VATIPVGRQQAQSLGIMQVDAERRITRFVEKPKHPESNLAIIGRYVLTTAVLRTLAATPPDRGGEIQLTEGLRRSLAAEAIYACTFPGRRYDAGNKAEFLRATVEIALHHPELGPGFRRVLEELLGQPVKA
jgi:UTP--glucose-1-phosphate uridylyltransferase